MTSDALHDLLTDYTPEVRELAQLMREVILTTVPAAREKVHLGWRNVGYSTTGGMRDQICAIGPMPDRINLYFARGADLADPAHLLEGSGKIIESPWTLSLFLIQPRAATFWANRVCGRGDARRAKPVQPKPSVTSKRYRSIHLLSWHAATI